MIVKRRIYIFLVLWASTEAQLHLEERTNTKSCYQAICSMDAVSVSGICSFLCTNGSIEYIFPCVQLMSLEDNCRDKVQHVIISSKVHYPNQTIPAYLVRFAQIKPADLRIDLENITTIEDYAFGGGAFGNLKSLTLTNLRVLTLGPRTFIGLDTLRNLTLPTVHLLHLPDCLFGVSNSIQQILVTSSAAVSSVFSLDNFTSGIELPNLLFITFRHNLRNALTRDVFASANNVQNLQLSNCLIEHIDPNAFYPIRNSVQVINLAGNSMKTLPTGFFSYLLPRNLLTIDLMNNPWDCGCHLSELQKHLRLYKDNFPDNVVCLTPLAFQHQLIRNSAFCGALEDESGEVVGQNPLNFMIIQCPVEPFDHEVFQLIQRLREVKFFVAWNHENGSAVLKIQHSEHYIKDMRMVAFTLHKHELIFVNYRCGCENKPIELNGRLDESALYTLCVQDTSTRMTISQNCITYFNRKRALVVWFRKRDRFAFSLAMLGVAMLLMFSGSLMTFLVRMHWNWSQNSTQPQSHLSPSARRLSTISLDSSTIYEEVEYFEITSSPAEPQVDDSNVYLSFPKDL